MQKKQSALQKRIGKKAPTNTNNRKEEATKEARLIFLAKWSVLQQLRRQEVIALCQYICGFCNCFCLGVTSTAIA